MWFIANKTAIPLLAAATQITRNLPELLENCALTNYCGKHARGGWADRKPMARRKPWRVTTFCEAGEY